MPVKVDAEDGEGRPLARRYGAHIRQNYPTILFIDPAAEATAGDQIVGKIPGFLPPATFADQLRLIAQIPRDLTTLREQHKAHPEDVEALPKLVAALAMQGRLKEAIDLATRARADRTDQAQDRWAAAYNVLGHELLFAMNLAQAGKWFEIAAQAAKRPIDHFNAHPGAGFTAALLRKAEWPPRNWRPRSGSPRSRAAIGPLPESCSTSSGAGQSELAGRQGGCLSTQAARSRWLPDAPGEVRRACQGSIVYTGVSRYFRTELNAVRERRRARIRKKA